MPCEPEPLKTRVALVADLFCGAGGSSTGARRALAALGVQINLVAVNHWNVAIETHSRNHAEARHYCQDVNGVKPAEVVPEGKLDLLMASPTCTYHSRARGGKPINDQGRMDPWAIVHWCTESRVRRLLVENVPEFVDWGPLDLRTGRPIKRRRGEYFRAWTAALQGAGFKLDWRILNAADFGDATTRERFFLMARSDGKRVHWPDPTHSRSGERDLLGHGRHKWRAAREIIDWSIEGNSIFDRKRPLSPKTLGRIYAGAVKFRWPEPFLVILANTWSRRASTALCRRYVPRIKSVGSSPTAGLISGSRSRSYLTGTVTTVPSALTTSIIPCQPRTAAAPDICASPLSPTSRVPTKAPTGQARGPKAHVARSRSRCRRCTPAACHML